MILECRHSRHSDEHNYCSKTHNHLASFKLRRLLNSMAKIKKKLYRIFKTKGKQIPTTSIQSLGLTIPRNVALGFLEKRCSYCGYSVSRRPEYTRLIQHFKITTIKFRTFLWKMFGHTELAYIQKLMITLII